MIIAVKVIPNSKKLEITKTGENIYRIKLNAPAVEGKANSRLVEVISDYFSVPKSSVTIVKGHKSRKKILEIL
ncbi:MAG: DUF167 domain-containing protein [Candidatus Aenigmarchaeota archaeon]|nr:DUF167 domain-containing protein [Candidatus Aenigmarchaeota archaeon]